MVERNQKLEIYLEDVHNEAEKLRTWVSNLQREREKTKFMYEGATLEQRKVHKNVLQGYQLALGKESESSRVFDDAEKETFAKVEEIRTFKVK